MTEKPCPCSDIIWIWGDFIKCLHCGKRYHSPDEAKQLKEEDD
jgi:hypothetical protein